MERVEFRAGRCEWDGKTVTPLPQKGILRLQTDDGLLHAKWISREPATLDNVEDDIIVINDAFLEAVPQCRDGRVVALRFTSSNQISLYWMQEPSAETDNELWEAFNRMAGCKRDEAVPDVGDPAGPRPGAMSPIARDDISRVMNAVVKRRRASQHPGGPPLTSLLAVDLMQTLLDDNEAREELMALLPPGQQNLEDLTEVLRSPQLQQAIRHFQAALQAEQLPLLLTTMGLNADAAKGATDPVAALVDALDRKYGREDTPPAAEPKATSSETAPEPETRGGADPPAEEPSAEDQSMEAPHETPHEEE